MIASSGPSPWRRWTNTFYARVQPVLDPGLLNSQHAYAAALQRAVSSARRWLDLGCGHQFLPDWMDPRERLIEAGSCAVTGIDYDADALARHPALHQRVRGNIEVLPFKSGTFDLVTANMVVEHVAQPGRLLAEVRRILAPGGKFLIHTPNAYGYTTALTRMIAPSLRAPLAGLLLGRDERDVYSTYYRANTTGTLHRLATGANLRVVEVRHVETSPQLIAIPPLLLCELLVIRALRSRLGTSLRPCIIAVFEPEERET